MGTTTLNAVKIRLQEFATQGDIVNSLPVADGAALGRLADELKIQIPDTPTEFYATYDYLQIGANEFNSVEQLASYLEGIRSYDRRIAKRYLPILDDAVGAHYLVRVAAEGNALPAEFGCVYAWAPEEREPPEYAAQNFSAFVIE